MRPFLLPILVLFTALATPAEAKVNFSDLPGTYTGAYQLVLGPTVLTGFLTVEVTANKSGKRLSFKLTGATSEASSPNVQLASFALLKLGPNHKVSSNSALIGFFQLLAANSTFTGSRGKFTFTLATTTPFVSTTTYLLKFSGKKLLLTGNGAAGASAVSIVFQGQKK